MGPVTMPVPSVWTQGSTPPGKTADAMPAVGRSMEARRT
jgi:hypothetical protein